MNEFIDFLVKWFLGGCSFVLGIMVAGDLYSYFWRYRK